VIVPRRRMPAAPKAFEAVHPKKPYLPRGEKARIYTTGHCNGGDLER